LTLEVAARVRSCRRRDGNKAGGGPPLLRVAVNYSRVRTLRNFTELGIFPRSRGRDYRSGAGKLCNNRHRARARAIRRSIQHPFPARRKTTIRRFRAAHCSTSDLKIHQREFSYVRTRANYAFDTEKSKCERKKKLADYNSVLSYIDKI
jgi:hypothetical protein